MHYPLASTTWDQNEYAAIQRVIESGMFSMGKEVYAFEQAFAEWVGCKYVVMVNSGSSANLAMIGALFFRKQNPLKAGDEVIVPAVSWSTTYYPLQQYGLKLKFVDIDKETLNFNLDHLEKAITGETKAILAVNLLGNPNDFKRIQNIIEGRNIILLEDNCESMGAQLDGKQAGTFGLMGTFSTFFSHHIATMEGGGIMTDDEELYHILLCLRAHGWTRNLPKFNHVCSEKSDNPFEESFRFVLPGYNLRPLEMSGAIGQEQVKKLPSLIEERRKNAFYFQEVFSDHPWISIQKEIGDSSWFGFSLILKENTPISRKDLVEKLSASNIDVRPIVAGNFAKNEVLNWFNYEIHDKLDNAEYIDQNGFFVGNHHYSLREQINYLKNIIGS
ncbi:pyridoxamine 5-phosphate oxidase [Chromobacterium violaceum]|uniref:DegT/DnrJ/EryC1/StrS family aminotransferase n=1 Tax=Chromobacterium violaceum TaxID=536 RepID=UPI0006534F19|nr:DegT/DnrJ/EryC1/StrS family aminotransferase [Chromobacterium violaceum]KMN48108.1 pyridoxamine 5-phosphate oxidase [Chromobacterium violaceum]KMN86499.1 pyridoxamine 5-phosphate oxidase [Chromobacterium violaceum]KMN89982.1 pyridoxamine 5-phosphate oxidase [Chromobacterium violaceum]KMO02104.1 pyridoxamine 5-phosphate oxidase [Chromobacterium violaceum]MCD0491989.1 DegT/DnrJ/EryC1/StrS family aminotransferase [Chromobacterium violaceum]